MAFSDSHAGLLVSPSLFLLGPCKKQVKSRNKEAQGPSPQSSAQRMTAAALGRGWTCKKSTTPSSQMAQSRGPGPLGETCTALEISTADSRPHKGYLPLIVFDFFLSLEENSPAS